SSPLRQVCARQQRLLRLPARRRYLPAPPVPCPRRESPRPWRQRPCPGSRAAPKESESRPAPWERAPPRHFSPPPSPIPSPRPHLKAFDNRRTPCRWHRDHPRPLRSNPAQALHLLESLPHPDQPHAAAGRIDDRVGQLALELLPQLVGHRLLALDAVRFFESGDVKPAFAVLLLGHVAPAIKDGSIKLAHVSAKRTALQDIGERR